MKVQIKGSVALSARLVEAGGWTRLISRSKAFGNICNALGVENSLLTKHGLYNALGEDTIACQSAYRHLFEHHVPDRTIEAIRMATNKAWVLGNDKFQRQVEDLTQRPAKPKSRGGDRRSEKVRNANRV